MSRPQKSPDSDPPSRSSRGFEPAGTTGDRQGFAQRIRIAVERANTPITVSKLAEQIHAPDLDSEYGDVHEMLYRDYLQNLDAEGVLVFDMDVGLVYSAESAADGSDDGYSA
ncbi:hypothetical protein [Halorussus salinisoli]|uniref:hypothetical protein n=1 Tax=Halorussus salinisoli TaxID=2558242 RepID=UPI0010C1DE3F|nr:hypothetical protein [Halorussus salinisoli]